MQGKTHGYYHNQIWNISSAQGVKINSTELIYDWYACNSNFTLIRWKSYRPS